MRCGIGNRFGSRNPQVSMKSSFKLFNFFGSNGTAGCHRTGADDDFANLPLARRKNARLVKNGFGHPLSAEIPSASPDPLRPAERVRPWAHRLTPCRLESKTRGPIARAFDRAKQIFRCRRARMIRSFGRGFLCVQTRGLCPRPESDAPCSVGTRKRVDVARDLNPLTNSKLRPVWTFEGIARVAETDRDQSLLRRRMRQRMKAAPTPIKA